ncbi:MAG: glutamine synthetase [Thermoleophilia bacterium]|nr:glutamine synthetase [Thermoleophilia bacterium]
MVTVEELEAAGVRILRLVYADLHGKQRGKDVLLERAGHALTHGKPFVEAVMTIDNRHNIVSGEAEGFRDLLAMADLKTARINPLDPEVAVVLCDLLSVPSHRPSGLDSRGALKRICARYAKLGFTPVVAHELEFYLLERDAEAMGGLRPLAMRDSSVYTAGPLADPTGIVRAMFDACDAFQLEPISMAQEYGHSQYEINLTHGEAVEASDRAFLFKALVKQMADMDGIVATFMGMPADDDESSGYHLHASLLDKAGKNIFDAPRASDGLSVIAHQFIAGVVEHASALAGLLNPTVNAYKRIANGGLSPKYANWGHDNRFAMLRISEERGPAARAEVRSGDGAANPYLIAAAILAAGFDGIERSLKSPKPVVGNFFDGPPAAMGLPLPTSLGTALDALEADTRLVKLVDPALIETFLSIKRYELGRWDTQQNRLTAWELEEYAEAL